MPRLYNEPWSGEATRSSGFAVEETRIDVSIGDSNDTSNTSSARKDRPVWMTESTVTSSEADDNVCLFTIYSICNILYIRMVSFADIN